MTTQIKTSILAIAGLLTGVLLLFLFRSCSEPEPIKKVGNSISYIEKIIKERDTVFIKAAAKIKYVKTTDTIKTTAFIATMDTVYKSDTIKARFNFPENEFEVSVKSKPDTLERETRTVYLEPEKENRSTLWYIGEGLKYAGVVAIGILIGFLAGK